MSEEALDRPAVRAPSRPRPHVAPALITALRSLAFNLAFGAISVVCTLAAAVAALRPGSGPVRRAVTRYVRAMLWAMRVIAGIQVEVRGRERLPPGDYILAPKHASYGDGFSIYTQVDDLAFVTGDHLERFPLFKTVLAKLGAVVVRRCGGPEARRDLLRSTALAHAHGRKLLIYPEGALAPVGVHYPYKAGVYHMARQFNLPVVPVASNLGVFWPQEKWTKRPGRAVIELLDPITPDQPRQTFLAELTRRVEERTAELVAEALSRPAVASVEIEHPPETAKRRRKPG